MLASDFQSPSDPVRAAAEAHETSLETSLYSAWANLSSSYQPWREPNLTLDFRRDLAPAAGCVLAAFGSGVAALGLDQIRKDTSEIEFRYDRVAPGTLAAAQATAAQWVREITDETRDTINQTIQAGMARGLPAPKIAQSVKESIGLTQAQAAAVANYRRQLEANSAKALDYRLRDKRFDATVEEAVAQLLPLPQSQIDRQVGSYYQRYLRFRSQTIARFEALFASNAGAVSAIEGAVASGALPANTVKCWLVAHDERLCPRCRSIPETQPHGVRLDQVFEWREGKKNSGTIMIPPLHPRCRCTVTYRVMR